MLSDTVLDLDDGFDFGDIEKDHNKFIIKDKWNEPKNQKKVIKLGKSFGLK